MGRADWWRTEEYIKGRESRLVEDWRIQKRGEPIGGGRESTEKGRAGWQWT